MIKQLRLLQIDDLMVLRDLADGLSITAIAQRMSLTQPAITQRLRKLETVFAVTMTEKMGRGLRLTMEGREIAVKATLALSILGSNDQKSDQLSLSLGVRPDVAISWLYPALIETYKQFPGVRAHIYQGTGDDILQRLGNGKLDAVISSPPIAIRDFNAIELRPEAYVFIAPTSLANKINDIGDLERTVLIEHDRSFPFQKYLPQETRSKLKFYDVQFMGGTRLMARAVADGLGVAIVPEFAAELYIANKSVKKILPKVSIEEDLFRLFYRRSTNGILFFESLAKSLKATPFNALQSNE